MNQEIYQLARYEIYLAAFVKVIAAILELVAYIPLHDRVTLLYDRWQEQDHPTRFGQIISLGNQAAYEWHSALAVVKQIAETPFPKCLVPVEFIGYRPSVNQSTLE
jgi:hypothetical protein